jgi:hypothetical protein
MSLSQAASPAAVVAPAARNDGDVQGGWANKPPGVFVEGRLGCFSCWSLIALAFKCVPDRSDAALDPASELEVAAPRSLYCMRLYGNREKEVGSCHR